jgi:hypothetical protein
MLEEQDSIARFTAIEFVKRIESAMNSTHRALQKARPDMAAESYRNLMDAWGMSVNELDFGVLEIVYRPGPSPEGITQGSDHARDRKRSMRDSTCCPQARR